MTPDSFPNFERILSYFRQLDELKRGLGAAVPEELQALRDQFVREWVAGENGREPPDVPPEELPGLRRYPKSERFRAVHRFRRREKPPPRPEAVNKEQVERLIRAMEQLPEGERTAIVLKHFASLSLQQIGERLGCTASALAAQLKRGLKKLRDLLQVEQG